MNSSYVLISIILSARLGTDREPPVGCLGKYILVNVRYVSGAVGAGLTTRNNTNLCENRLCGCRDGFLYNKSEILIGRPSSKI